MNPPTIETKQETTEQTVDVETTGMFEQDKIKGKTLKIKLVYTWIDVLLLFLICAGIVLAGTCKGDGRCWDIQEIGDAGVYMIIAGFTPYALILVFMAVRRVVNLG